MMANLGMADSLILMVLALVVLGPRRLPELGRQIGKLMYEFRKASNDFKFQMEEELRQAEESDRRKKAEEERQRALAAAPPSPVIAPPLDTAAASDQPSSPASTGPPLSIGADISDPGPSLSATYPSETAVESPQKPTATPSESAPAAAPSFVPDEPVIPRILPPSTGEKVAAGRPGTQPAQQDLFASTPHESGIAPESVAPESERSEQTAHHG
jgi:sec-independent protein translocase protein TatB